jgi:hypothetical protein
MKKKWMLIGLLSTLIIPTALADIGSTLQNVWFKILGIGNLSFLGLSDGYVIVAFTRLLIWILMFAVFFALTTSLGGKGGSLSFLKRNHALVVSFVIATIAAVFLPAQVLLATGAGWATAIALILIGGPIVGIAYLLWKVPGKGNETKFTVIVKLLLCLLMFWILSAMKFHVGRMI